MKFTHNYSNPLPALILQEFSATLNEIKLKLYLTFRASWGGLEEGGGGDVAIKGMDDAFIGMLQCRK